MSILSNHGIRSLLSGPQWRDHHGAELVERIQHNRDFHTILEDIVAWHAALETSIGKERADTCLAVIAAHYVHNYQNIPDTITIEI